MTLVDVCMNRLRLPLCVVGLSCAREEENEGLVSIRTPT